MEKRKKRRWPWLLAALALVLILLGLDYWNLLPHRTYTAEHFGIETLQSPLDADGDGIDDYTDLMLGARQDAENHPAPHPQQRSAPPGGGRPAALPPQPPHFGALPLEWRHRD